MFQKDEIRFELNVYTILNIFILNILRNKDK